MISFCFSALPQPNLSPDPVIRPNNTVMARTKQIASKFIEQSTRYHQPNPESAEAVIVISDDEEQAEEEKDNLFQNSQNVQPQQEEQPQQRQRQQRQQQHHHRESEEEDENEDLQQNEQDSQVGVNRANKSAVCAAISSSVSRLLPQVDDVIVDDASNQRIVLLHQQTLLSSDDVYCWILQGKGKQTAASSGSTSTSNTYFRRESFSSSSSSSKRPRITPPDFEMNRLSLENIFTFLSTPPSHTTPTSTNELDNNDAPLIMVGKALIKFPTSLADGPDCPDGQRLLVTSTTYFHDGDRKPVVNSLLFWAAISLSSKKFLFEIASVISPESLPSPARRFVHLAVNALNDGYTAEAVWDNSSLSVTVSFYTSTVINQSVSEKKFAASDRFNLFVFLKGSSRSSSPTQYSRRLYLPEKYRMDENDELLQPDSLQPTLMKYQRRALAWMLEREGVLDSDLPLFLTSSRVDRQPPHIWQCGLPDGNRGNAYERSVFKCPTSRPSL